MPATLDALENQIKLFDAAIRSATINRHQHVALVCQEKLGVALFKRALTGLSKFQRDTTQVKIYPPNSLRSRAARLSSGSMIFVGLLETRSLLEVPELCHIFLGMPTDVDQLTWLMSEARRATRPDGSIILLNDQLVTYIKKGHPNHSQDALTLTTAQKTGLID